jgi:hypothetical protein
MTAQHSVQNTTAFIGNKKYPPRYVSVVLGNPRSEECAGFGLCRLDEDWPLPGQTPPPPKPKPVKSLINCQSNYCRGIASVERVKNEDERTSLSFSFLKSELTPEAVKKYFGTTHFIVGNDLALPRFLTDAFDVDSSVLKAGLYQIIETNDYFQIQIQVT